MTWHFALFVSGLSKVFKVLGGVILFSRWKGEVIYWKGYSQPGNSESGIFRLRWGPGWSLAILANPKHFTCALQIPEHSNVELGSPRSFFQTPNPLAWGWHADTNTLPQQNRANGAQELACSGHDTSGYEMETWANLESRDVGQTGQHPGLPSRRYPKPRSSVPSRATIAPSWKDPRSPSWQLPMWLARAGH